MGYSDRDLFMRWWKDGWAEGNWGAAWSKAVEGLTPEQAAWRPPNAPGVPGVRKSVWQIVEHMVFWRMSWLGRLDGGSSPTAAELDAGNWPEIADVSEAAWADARRRFRETHERIGEAVRTRHPEADPAMWFLPHDSYHVGQIMYVRAMLGLAPIE